jgi:predicted membrane channel-forming protein YqfA (hemolysin III family)
MRLGRWHRVSVEELANTVTHGVGLALSIGGFVALLIQARPVTNEPVVLLTEARCACSFWPISCPG